MRSLVLLFIFLALPTSARATLVPGSEHGVTAPALDVAAFDQTGAAIATDGDSFLAVWIDFTVEGSGDVHGMRVSPEGKRVDDQVIPIAVTDANEGNVAVAFGGDRYLVIWSTQTALLGRFVSRDATMSDVFEIESSSPDFLHPSLAFNGSRFLAVWISYSYQQFEHYWYRGAIIGSTGQVVTTFDVTDFSSRDFALVAANGAFHFVTSELVRNGAYPNEVFTSDIGATSIDENGVLSPRAIVVPATTPVRSFAATSTASEILIIWNTIGPGSTAHNVRVTSSGVGAIGVVPVDGMSLQGLVADAEGFLLFYGNYGAKHWRRLGSTEPFGTVAASGTNSWISDVSSNGERTLVIVRGEGRAGFGPAGSDLYVTRLDTNEVEPLVVAPRHQTSPDIAAAGDLHLAAWCEYIGSDRRLSVVVARLDADGVPLTRNGIDLHSDDYDPVAPRVASNGTDWLVVWGSGYKVLGSRVAHDGTLLDAAPFRIASDTDSYVVAVSWDGTQYVVIYRKSLHAQQSLQVVRVSADGIVAPQEATLSMDGALPAIASSPYGSLVIWRAGSYLQSELRGALLSPEGTVTPLAFSTTDSLGDSTYPSVAWNGATFIVAAPFRSMLGNQLRWLFVSPEGVIRSPNTPFLEMGPLRDGSSGFPGLAVEAHGDEFLVYWHGVEPIATVFAARIDHEGQLADTPVAIGSTPPGFIGTNINATGDVVMYARRIGHTTREITRAFARKVYSVDGNPRRRAASHGTR